MGPCYVCHNQISITEPACPFCSTKNNFSLVGQTFNANYFNNALIAQGGKMAFMKDGVLFRPHELNFSTKETFIPYSFMSSFSKGIIPTKLFIHTKDGQKHSFVVFERDKKIAFLNEVISEFGTKLSAT